jgi:hypothetical protein
MANVERLKQLRRVVEQAPEHRFHMNHWCDTNAGCGTAYCAAGWAALDPWFRENTEIEQIFKLEHLGPDPEIKGLELFDVRSRDWPYIGRTFGRLADMFDIEDEESERLFGQGLEADDSHNHVVTKAEVLERIDGLIEGQEIEPYEAVIESAEDDEDEDFDEEE